MVPLIIDHRVPHTGDRDASLLTMPVGATNLIGHILEWLGSEGLQRPMVLTSFDSDERYAARLRAQCAADLGVVSGCLASALEHLEPADVVVLADSSRVPLLDLDVAQILPKLAQYRGATHLVAIGRRASTQACERVECDREGRIRKVQRLMGAMHWPEVAHRMVVMTVASAGSLRGVVFKSLDELRAQLAIRGAMIRDEPLAMDLVDLTSPSGLLVLNEHMTLRALSNGARARFVELRHNVLCAPGCTIDPSARLVGPLIIHENTIIEHAVAIVGPGVVGAGCRIERGATIARAVLCPGTRVEAEAQLRHCVVSGRCNGKNQHAPVSILSTTRLSRVFAESAEPQGTVSDPPPGTCVQRVVKRSLDLIVALVGLCLLAPLMLLVAVLIKLESKGPILFTHLRERRGGREFPCYKFRTMVAGAHHGQRELYARSEVDGPQFKIKDDPRVTRLGNILRVTNLDELPQLINVLLGHMSLVGPRPSPFRENQICIPWRRARLSVPPGITGLWQVCRSKDRSRGDFHEWIYYDMAYVRNFSLWLDAKVLAATVLTFGGRFSAPARWMVPIPPAHGTVRRLAA